MLRDPTPSEVKPLTSKQIRKNTEVAIAQLHKIFSTSLEAADKVLQDIKAASKGGKRRMSN